MPLRPFKLPGDLSMMVDVLPKMFQYPENEAWNVQEDEVESMVDMVSGVRRMWLLIRMLQLVVPTLRDVMRGYVWDEDGQPVGLTNVIREGMTDQWMIGNVGVLPAYRRRGIARRLVQAAVDYARERGAKTINLDVVDGNVPAYNLYESMGFVHFSTQSELVFSSDTALPAIVPLPGGYRVVATSLSDWRPRFEMAQRIIPAQEQLYMPVEEGRYRQPAILRPFLPLLERAFGGRSFLYNAISPSGQVVGQAHANVRMRAGGLNMLRIVLDPAHGEIAPHLVRMMLAEIGRTSPGRRIDLHLRHWQKNTIDAALAAGFTRQLDMCSMGIVVE